MKKIILLALTIMSLNSFCQVSSSPELRFLGDSISVKKCKSSLYQYRISFSQLSTSWSTNIIQSDLYDIFKSQVIYSEPLRQFVFTSCENIDKVELLKKFINLDITYFKKIPLFTTNEL